MYKIIRFYRNGESKTIKMGLTLEEAQKHCRSKRTQRIDKDGNVVWFDGYDKETIEDIEKKIEYLKNFDTDLSLARQRELKNEIRRSKKVNHE